MFKKIFLIADFFYKDFTGGAELNDNSLIQRFLDKGIEVETKYCKEVDIDFLKNNLESYLIVGNFVTLSETSKNYMIENNKYIIYEHDHKYLKKRNPIFYNNFIAPEKDLANINFYQNAISTICLTQLAVDVFVENTKLTNVKKVGASVWSDEDLNYISILSKNKKNEKFAIMDSNNPIKKRNQCIEYCNRMNYPYDLIKDRDNKIFLEKLSRYKGLIFMTGHLETCCRLIVEAKMMNCDVITQKKLIGAASEEWFSLEGEELIEKIRDISKKSVDIFLECMV